MLHTVNKSPYTHSTLAECSKVATPGSSILLIEDGVFAVQAGGAKVVDLNEIMKDKTVYALEPDIKARGISKVCEGVKVIGYDGFVDLAVESKSHAWV